MSGQKRYSPLLVVLILILCGTGAWISGQLVKQHADSGSLRTTAGLFTGLCRASERIGFGCAEAVKGPWSEVKIPIPWLSGGFTLYVRTVVVPVAFIGLAYFVFVGIWFLFIGGPRPVGRHWHRIPLCAALCGAAMSLFYTGIMALGYAPWCFWCLVVHLSNFLLAGAVWRLWRGSRSFSAGLVPGSSSWPGEAARAALTSREAISVIAFSLIIIAGLWGYRREHLALRRHLGRLEPYRALVTCLRQDRELLLREYYAQPQHEIPLRAGESVPGDRPRLVVFTDFECLPCYCNSLQIHRIARERFNGRLAVSVCHYPLCRDCNGKVTAGRHRNACRAAYAAEAARLLGGDEAFRRMQSLLFENRQKLGMELYPELAAQIGLDPEVFLRELEGEAVREIVESDIRLAHELGVNATPTMFLNGRRVTRLCQTRVFWQAIADKLSPVNDKGLIVADGAQQDSAMNLHSGEK